MKILTFLTSSLLIISCGKSEQPIYEEVSVLTPPETSFKVKKEHNIYIIAGQSNAGRLLASIHGDPFPAHNTGYYPTNTSYNSVGYGLGGASLAVYSETSNFVYLKDIIINYCEKKPLLVWWQGENDVVPVLNLNYKTQLTSFFIILRDLCPSLEILNVTMEDSNIAPISDWSFIQQIQNDVGDFHISSQNYDMEDAVHLSNAGYEMFFNNLKTKYPLR
jgi:hypothetical protein